jgi:hypothetical protein
LQERWLTRLSKNLWFKKCSKKLPQQAKKQPNIAKMLCGTPKTRRFSAFPSHFSKIFFKKLLIRQFQRFALVVCGRDEIRSEDEKKLEASLPKVVIAQGKMLDAKRAAESPTPPHAHLS